MIIFVRSKTKTNYDHLYFVDRLLTLMLKGNNIVFVMKRLIRNSKLEIVRSKCGFHEGTCVKNIGHSRGTGLWLKDLAVNLISFLNCHILVEVKDDQ